jgi:hypothetical protein
MTDKDRIKALGGPTKVAELLGYDKAKGGVQRVQNWLDRGIPPKVKVAYPHIFLTDLPAEAKAGA